MPTPVKPRKFVSQFGIETRDTLLEAVRKEIVSKKIDHTKIFVNGRPMSTKMAERLRRGGHEFDNWSLRGACSLAEAVRIRAAIHALQ